MATNALRNVLNQTEGAPAAIGNNLVKLWHGAAAIPSNIWQFMQNPRSYAGQMENQMLDNSRENIARLHQAFGNPNEPWDITDPEAAMRTGMAGIGFAPIGLEAELESRLVAMGGEDVVARRMMPRALDAFRQMDPIEEAHAATLGATTRRLAYDAGTHVGEKTIHHAFEQPEDSGQMKGNKDKVKSAWQRILGAL